MGDRRDWPEEGQAHLFMLTNSYNFQLKEKKNHLCVFIHFTSVGVKRKEEFNGYT